VGGENPPRAQLRLLNGTLFTCNITQKYEFRIARELGQQLYSTVGVRGKAQWDTRDMSLQYFLIEEVTPYRRKAFSESVAALSDIAGTHLEQIDDINAFVTDLRGRDEA
jgi:hypothetical protein